jgi:hypothetical protein
MGKPGVKPLRPELAHLKYSRTLIIKLRPADLEQVQAVVHSQGISASAFGRRAILRAVRRLRRQYAEKGS